VDAAPVDAAPVDAAPVDAAPVDAAPVDAAPVDALIVPIPGDATPIDLDLGHVASIDRVIRSGNAAVSKDVLRHWVLWDLAARRAVISGDVPPCVSPVPPCRDFTVALAGATLAVRSTDGIELRAATTGERLTVLATAVNAGLASDGSYAWIATASRLHARSRSGATLVEVSGDYSHAAVFAAPDQLRVIGGPAGSHALEVISTIDGRATTVPFTGTFVSWFDDGRRFLTVIGTVVYVFSSAGVRQTFGTLASVERLTGQGDFVWTLGAGTLRVYAVAALSTPLQTFDVPAGIEAVSAGPVIGLVPYGVEHLDLLSLGATITRRQLPVPAAYLSAFAGDAAGHWIVGGGQGAVFDGDAIAGAPGTAQSLSLGRPWALAGSPGSTAVIGTGSRRTAVLTLGESDTAVRVLDVPAFHATITADETMLVAADDLDETQYHEDRSVRVISLATGAVTYTRPYAWSDTWLLVGFELAPEAQILTYDLERSALPYSQAQYASSDLHGAPLAVYGPTPSDQTTPFPHLSPDGIRAAFTIRGTGAREDPERNLGATTQLYRNGTLVAAVDGVFQAWLDHDRLAVATYRIVNAKYGVVGFDTMNIYDGEGTLLGPARLPEPQRYWQPPRGTMTSIDGRLVYLRNRNAVYDTATGAVVWQGDTAATNGVIVGRHVVYTRGCKVYRASFAAIAGPASQR